MVARSGLFVAPSSGVGAAPVDARLALAGLIGATPQTVSGGAITQSGSSMQFTIAPAVMQLPDQTNAAATFVSPIDQTILTPAVGPVTGSRIDLIVGKQNDPQNADPDARASFSLIAGTAGAPGVAPAVPAGFFRYADIAVPTNAANAAACTVTLRSPTTFAPPDILSTTLAILKTVTGQAGQQATVTADGANNGQYFWNAAQWQRILSGFNLIVPTSVANGTVSALGTATFTALASGTLCLLGGVFTSAFTVYKVIINVTTASAAANVVAQLAAAGVLSATGYDSEAIYTSTATAVTGINTNANDTRWQVTIGAATRHTVELLISSPAQAVTTLINGFDNGYTGTGSTPSLVAGGHRAATAFDGFAVGALTNNITGTVQVYGLAS